MKNLNEEDQAFYQLMQKSRLTMPFSDFEDKVMRKIHQEARHRQSVFRDIKLSTFFFITGTVFGILLTVLLPKLDSSIFGIAAHQLLLPFQLIFIFLFLTQLEALMKVVRRQMKG